MYPFSINFLSFSLFQLLSINSPPFSFTNFSFCKHMDSLSTSAPSPSASSSVFRKESRHLSHTLTSFWNRASISLTNLSVRGALAGWYVRYRILGVLWTLAAAAAMASLVSLMYQSPLSLYALSLSCKKGRGEVFIYKSTEKRIKWMMFRQIGNTTSI